MKGRGFLASDTADGIPTRGSAVRKNMSFGSGKWRVTRLGLAAAAAGITLAVDAAQPALSQGTVIVGMTAGDIPLTTGNPDQGFEGYRFVGFNLYDGLLLWDLSRSDAPSDIKPGLATSWEVDPANHRRWIFKLRQGVKWHDGCPFTADDVLWNFGRVTNT